MLKLKEFRIPEIVTPPMRDWYAKTTGIKMHRNDELGICTCAGGANLDQVWTANIGRENVIPDDIVTREYCQVSGYVPGKPDTDNGACLSDVLKHWQNETMFGAQIGPYLAVDPDDWDEICYACNVGIGLYCGMSLPQGAMDAMEDEHPVWDVPTTREKRRILGGHCVINCSYDLHGQRTGTGTWAKVVETTAEFVAHYFSEMYVIFSPDFMKDGVAPNGLNGEAVLDAMQQVKD